MTATISDALTPAETATFAELGLPDPMVRVLGRSGIHSPFAIQVATIPDALGGRDILGRAQTGAGKTLAFGLPMIARLDGFRSEPHYPLGLILVPTRELAMQVHDGLEPIARSVGLRMKIVAGGMSMPGQITSLERGVEIVVATPGRLLDLMRRGACELSAVEVTVIDEADHMAELGFMEDITAILDATTARSQRLLFSATLDGQIAKLAGTYLDDPVEHSVSPASASVETMTHHVISVDPKLKADVTNRIAARRGRTLAFVRTQHGADRVAAQLRDVGVMAAALHGGMTQGARNRVLGGFRDGGIPVLVATDVAARGIHVDDVSLVLHVDPPAGPKDYLHRAGRTARAGEDGLVVTLALPHQRRTVSRLLDDAGVLDTVDVSVSWNDRADEELDALGAREPNGEPLPEPRFDRPRRESGPRKSHGRPGRREFSRR